MLKSSLCDYSDAYILVKGTIEVDNASAAGAAANNTNKKVILKASVHYFLSNSYLSLNDSPLKIMKNIFYFI